MSVVDKILELALTPAGKALAEKYLIDHSISGDKLDTIIAKNRKEPKPKRTKPRPSKK